MATAFTSSVAVSLYGLPILVGFEFEENPEDEEPKVEEPKAFVLDPPNVDPVFVVALPNKLFVVDEAPPNGLLLLGDENDDPKLLVCGFAPNVFDEDVDEPNALPNVDPELPPKGLLDPGLLGEVPKGFEPNPVDVFDPPNVDPVLEPNVDEPPPPNVEPKPELGAGLLFPNKLLELCPNAGLVFPKPKELEG